MQAAIITAVATAAYLSGLPLPLPRALPPLPVVVRRLRPVIRFTFLAALAGYRIRSVWRASSHHSIRRPSGFDAVSDGSDDFPWNVLKEAGLFSALEAFLSTTVTNVLSEINGSASSTTIIPPPVSQWIVDLAQRTLPLCFILLNDLLGLLLLVVTLSFFRSLRRWHLSDFRDDVTEYAYGLAVTHIPAIRRAVAKEEAKVAVDVARTINKDLPADRTSLTTLPEHGRANATILEELNSQALKEDAKWRKGRVSGSVYGGERENMDLMAGAFAAYVVANPLHVDVWPSVSRMEAEVVAMTASLLDGSHSNSGEGVEGAEVSHERRTKEVKAIVGATTSGGTESIFLAVRAAVGYYGRKHGITQPEIVACKTAHAGLDKACESMGIRLISVPADPITYQFRAEDAERAMTADTVMIYASAPNYPQGVIDPIEELSDVALRHGVGLHVDACLGGFVLPFADSNSSGSDAITIPPFDFRCPGVTSMSCDTHKYGYAAKGTSVVLYRHSQLRRAQYFAFPKWTGGLYITPTLAGSRSGALIACAWASLVSNGREGYRTRAKKVLDAAKWIGGEIERGSMGGLHLVGGAPRAMVVCFGSDEYDVYRVGDVMAERGWSLNTLQDPPCVHLCVTLPVAERAEMFVEALRDVAKKIKAEGTGRKKSGNAAVYGMASTLPPGPVEGLLKVYTDTTLTT